MLRFSSLTPHLSPLAKRIWHFGTNDGLDSTRLIRIDSFDLFICLASRAGRNPKLIFAMCDVQTVCTYVCTVQVSNQIKSNTVYVIDTMFSRFSRWIDCLDSRVCTMHTFFSPSRIAHTHKSSSDFNNEVVVDCLCHCIPFGEGYIVILAVF